MIARLLDTLNPRWYTRKLGFEGDLRLRKTIGYLASKYQLRVAVETGTRRGYTARQLARTFDRVTTIEHNAELAPEIDHTLRKDANVTVLFSDSAQALLAQVFPALNEPALFYLDAHTGAEVDTLSNELRALAEFAHRDRSVLVIHDFMVPGSGLGHNGYTLELLEPLLRDINKRFIFKFHRHAGSLGQRGALFALPDR